MIVFTTSGAIGAAVTWMQCLVRFGDRVVLPRGHWPDARTSGQYVAPSCGLLGALVNVILPSVAFGEWAIGLVSW